MKTAAPAAKSKPAKPQPKVKMITKPGVTPSWVGRVPRITPGRYADGMPFHQIGYVCCKLILRPNRFNSRQSLYDFAEVMRGPARELGVGLSTKGYDREPLKIREVLFLDTPDFRLYNNSFILRRRIMYEEGFPVGDPEVVFKYRNPDIQKAAETDVRPNIRGDHRVKFKAQALPLKDQLGGVRLLYSHNVQFQRSAVGSQNQALTFEAMAGVFPVLANIKHTPDEKVSLVSDTIVEEVLQDICLLDFGQGLTAKADVAIWRTRGEHRPLIGEFAYQFKFKDRDAIGREAMARTEAFFVALQYAAMDWISLNATKTGVVYRMLGNPPKANE